MFDLVEADGDVRASVPHQEGRMERRSGAQKDTKRCNDERASTAVHLALVRRMSQALCRALVYGRGSPPAITRLWTWRQWSGAASAGSTPTAST